MPNHNVERKNSNIGNVEDVYVFALHTRSETPDKTVGKCLKDYIGSSKKSQIQTIGTRNILYLGHIIDTLACAEIQM